MYLDTVLRSLFGGDNDDSIRGSGAIDSRSRSILQNRKGFDVIRIDSGQGIGSTWCSIIGYRNPVNHNQRVVTGIQGSAPTDTDATPRSWLTVSCRYIQSRHLALNQFLRRGNRSLVHVFGFDSHHRAAQIVFLD